MDFKQTTWEFKLQKGNQHGCLGSYVETWHHYNPGIGWRENWNRNSTVANLWWCCGVLKTVQFWRTLPRIAEKQTARFRFDGKTNGSNNNWGCVKTYDANILPRICLKQSGDCQAIECSTEARRLLQQVVPRVFWSARGSLSHNDS